MSRMTKQTSLQKQNTRFDGERGRRDRIFIEHVPNERKLEKSRVAGEAVVKLADCQSFTLKEVWRDAADFVTLADDHHMGIKLTRETASDGDISVYFGKGVTQQEQVIFANYIHAYLEGTRENALQLRHYVCPKCHTAKGNPEALMKKLLAKKHDADTECDGCGERFPLWDALEKEFARDAVRRQVEELQADDLAKLSTSRRGKLLVLDVGARITSANQKWMEVPGG